MSKTYSRVYGHEYRAGRRLRWWEKLMFLMKGTRHEVEEWITDERGDADFLIALFAGIALTAAGIILFTLAQM